MRIKATIAAEHVESIQSEIAAGERSPNEMIDLGTVIEIAVSDAVQKAEQRDDREAEQFAETEVTENDL